MKIIIVGGGFAGLRLAQKLSNKREFEILLLDKINFHQFQPLFYQVATAGLDASNISFPLRKIFQRSRNVRIRLTEVHSVDHQKKEIQTSTGNYTYDLLVLATGANTNFFGNKELMENALPMKSTEEALQIRHWLIQNFEDALNTDDQLKKEMLMTVVVVGAGPTGVELSGAIAELKANVLPKDYPDLDLGNMKIILLEGMDRTLGAMSERSSVKSRQYLERLGVEVRTGALVSSYNGNEVTLRDGSIIPSATVIWAAGIKGNVPQGIDKTLIVRGDRIMVDRFNQVEGMEGLFVLGDLAYMSTPLYPGGHPQVANVAVTQAGNLALNLLNLSRGKPMQPYEYQDKGSMATVGKHLAVVDIPKPKLHIGGVLAWYIWMGLHLFLLVGVKNRIQVFINWIYHYFTSDQSLRLLFKNFYRNTKR